MNTTEAVVHLKRFGYKAYKVGEYFRIWFKGHFEGYYTGRELIAFAKSRRNEKWKPATNKSKIGCGGKNCTCCTKAPPAELKKWQRKRERHEKMVDMEQE